MLTKEYMIHLITCAGFHSPGLIMIVEAVDSGVDFVTDDGEDGHCWRLGSDGQIFDLGEVHC